MDFNPIRIVWIGNNSRSANAMMAMLTEGHSNGSKNVAFEIARMDHISNAEKYLGEVQVDLILLDLSQQNGEGLDTIGEVSAVVPHIPIVVLGKGEDESTAARAVQAGAQDYLVWGHANGPLMGRAIQYAIDRKRTEQALMESEARFKGIFENVAIGLYRSTPDGDLLMANPSLIQKLGFTSFDQLAELNLREAGFSLEYSRSVFNQLLEQHGQIIGLESAWLRQDGTTFFVRESARAVRDKHGKTMYIEGTVEDITERVRAQEDQRLTAQVFDHAIEGVLITDADANIIKVNKAFTEVTGYSSEEVIGKNPRLLQSGRHDREFYRKLWDILLRQGFWRGEIWNRRKNGEIHPEWLTISAIKNNTGRITNFVGFFIDITTRRQNESLLRYLATHDPLTSLPNRSLFRDRLRRAIIRAQRSKQKIAVLMVDLDMFKEVNDNHGHAYGDKVLQSVAERLRECVRESDTVARLGGDEFTIILEGMGSKKDVATVVKKIMGINKEPYLINGHKTTITVSIGVGLFPDDSDNLEHLLQIADDAMYAAKDVGRNSYQYWSSRHET